MIKGTIVTMSSAHLTLDTIDGLNNDTYYCNLGVYPYEYGWFIFIGDKDYDEAKLPSDLKALIEKAEKAGADWLQLDCDVPFEDDLPTYDEDYADRY